MKALILPPLGAVVLGGAFVITMGGTQYYGADQFAVLTGFEDTVASKVIAWIAAISCGYVMAFSRGTEMHDEIKRRFNPASKEIKILSSSPTASTAVVPKSPEVKMSIPGKVLGVVGGIAGTARSIALGFIATKSLLNGVSLTHDKVINGLAIYVCFSNTLAYLHFTLLKAIKNTDYALGLMSGRIKLSVAASPYKKWLAIGITLPSMISTFGYFYLSTYGAFANAPYSKELEENSLIAIALPITTGSILTGGIAKGVQLYKYLIDTEVAEDDKQELKQVTSVKIKAHQTAGFFYTITYFLISLVGLFVLSDIAGWNRSASAAPWLMFAGMGALLEYTFSTRIMINTAKKNELTRQRQAALFQSDVARNELNQRLIAGSEGTSDQELDLASKSQPPKCSWLCPS